MFGRVVVPQRVVRVQAVAVVESAPTGAIARSLKNRSRRYKEHATKVNPLVEMDPVEVS